MKTKEFIEKVQKMGYTEEGNKLFRHVYYYQNIVASIDTDEKNLLTVNSANYELIKLCIEYAETPIAKREEEKKYIVQLPNPKSYHNFALYKDDYYGVVIMPFNYKDWKKEEIYHLTESEIKRNHEYLWKFAKEVEADDE